MNLNRETERGIPPGFVDVMAGGLDERGKGTSFDMTVTPEIDRRTVPVVTDKLAGTDADRGKVVVVGGERDKRGARSEEGDVEGPQVLEWWENRECRVEAD